MDADAYAYAGGWIDGWMVVAEYAVKHLWLALCVIPQPATKGKDDWFTRNDKALNREKGVAVVVAEGDGGDVGNDDGSSSSSSSGGGWWLLVKQRWWERKR